MIANTRQRVQQFGRTALRYRIEKWAWIVMITPTVIWWHSSVLWVALLSIYALVLTAGGAERAAEAAAEATEANKKEGDGDAV